MSDDVEHTACGRRHYRPTGREAFRDHSPERLGPRRAVNQDVGRGHELGHVRAEAREDHVPLQAQSNGQILKHSGVVPAGLGLIAILRAVPALADFSIPEGLRCAATHQPVEVSDDQLAAMADFLRNRLTQQLADEGHRFDLIEAVLPFADRPAFTADRLAELESLVSTDRFRDVATALQRVSRILPDDACPADDFGLLNTASERRLIRALHALPVAEDETTTISDWLDRVAGLPDAVDAFFEEVLVMDTDLEIRAQRLGLLAALDTAAASRLSWNAVRL
jgi:glycyl-tRNA synthetase